MSATHAGSFPGSRLEWLRKLVAERFSADLRLDVSEGHYRLTLPGTEGSVQIDRDMAAFAPGSPQPGCSRWRVDHGFRPAFRNELPAPGVRALPNPLVETAGDVMRIHYDIFGLAYWMLSRCEEVGRQDLDRHGRFPATASHAYREGYLDRPIVDEWFAILAQAIRRLWPFLSLSTSSFSVVVSHDVDSPSRYGFGSASRLAKVMIGDVVKRHDLRSAISAPLIRARNGVAIPPSDPSNTFDWIMDVSEGIGLRSAFYFICGRTNPGKDALYDPEHPAIRALIRKIHARGHEIGLHPSYETFLAPDSIVSEAVTLKRICLEEGVQQVGWGGRMHFLRWRVGVTLQGWERAGMTYDSTLGYADLPGFRCGTCHEYQAYDPVLERSLDVRIRPLVAMECTVMAPRYMGLGTGHAASEKFLELRRACEAVDGKFTLLWHNTELETDTGKELYRGVIA